MAPMNRAQRWRHRLWEISWGLQRYKLKKPVKKAIFDFGIADTGLNILNPHKRGPVGAVGAVGIPLMAQNTTQPVTASANNLLLGRESAGPTQGDPGQVPDHFTPPSRTHPRT